MKKALIILTILLVLGGILFGLYYFFWTAENFSHLGDRAMTDGDYKTAISRYEMAVDLEPGNAEYVLALVDACLADSSFSKAERTLVTAIRKKPSTELYCKLSEVYLAQDKLLDAQKMLDGITDTSVLSEITALRPQAPVFTPESGLYDEYISVEISAENAVIYYSMDEQYPSTANGAYAEPIALTAGVTQIKAIAVGSNGLVSPIVSADYQIVGVVEPVTFASTELEAYVRELLYVARTDSVMTDQLWTITELTMPENVTDFSDLRYFTSLNALTIHNSSVEDYTFLTYTQELQTLDLAGCLISAEALEQIATLPKLQALNLSGCGLSNIHPLSALTGLVSLDLSDNSISDIKPLEDCTLMITLNLANNAVKSLSTLAALEELMYLDITGNHIDSIAPLSGCTDLVSLIADNNVISDISPLEKMHKLTTLTLANNSVADVSALAGCGLLERLELPDNQLTAIDVLSSLTRLTYLDISHNQVASLPALAPTMALQQFYASYNLLQDVSALAGLKSLTYVDVDYNEELEDIECLQPCTLLVQVNAFGTKVKEVTALTNMGVIVNYNPVEEDE